MIHDNQVSDKFYIKNFFDSPYIGKNYKKMRSYKCMKYIFYRLSIKIINV